MDLLDDEKDAILANVGTLSLLATAPRANCLMLMRGDKALAVGGWAELEPGIADMFVIPDKDVLRAPKELIKAMRGFIAKLEISEWCHRMRTWSVATPRIDKWMTTLKFRCEGYAKSYTKTGEPYKLWSREKVNGIWQPN